MSRICRWNCNQAVHLSLQVNARDFFLGYRKIDIQPHEILLSVFVPFTSSHQYIREFKQAHRRDDDIAIVNAGMYVRVQEDSGGAPVLLFVDLT